MENESLSNKQESGGSEVSRKETTFWPLSRKLMLASALIVLLTVSLTFVMVLRLNLRLQTQRFETELHDLGVMVAANPLVEKAFRLGCTDKDLDSYLDNLVVGVGSIDVVTLAGLDEVRLYHINRNLVGQKFVGGDADRVVAGETYFSRATGTLGPELRFFVPVFDSTNGKQIGFVMTAALISSIESQRWEIISDHLRVMMFAMFVALVCSWFGAQRIKKSLLGYEPRQLTRHFLERGEVLNSLEEGIIAVDVNGVIKLANKAARSMIPLQAGDMGVRKLDDIYPQIRVGETLAEELPLYNNGITFGDVNIICDRIPIKEQNKVIGAVAILRNRTEMTRMAEELTGVNHMIDALRSNTHEFMNKLHVILGLLRIGAPDEAEKYISGISSEHSEVITPILQKIQNKNLGALILGKMSHCRELDITFNLDSNSSVPAVSEFLTGNAFTTLVGNLVENAIEAVNAKGRKDGEREVTLLVHEDERSLMITVDDSGVGMTPEDVEHVRKGGWSTKGRHRGTGMRLIQSVLASSGGEMQIDSEKDVGTSITVCFTRRENCD